MSENQAKARLLSISDQAWKSAQRHLDRLEHIGNGAAEVDLDFIQWMAVTLAAEIRHRMFLFELEQRDGH